MPSPSIDLVTANTSAAAPFAVRVSNVTVWRWSEKLAHRTTLLHDITWEAGMGEHWVILGPNGAGKTTLLNLAGAVTHPSSGSVEVLGKHIGRVDMRELRGQIGFVDPNISRSLRGSYTALEIVLTGTFGSLILLHRRLTREHNEHAAAMLEMVGAVELRDRHFEECSQGERQRILLARALMSNPSLLLLDEPTSGLDLPSRERLVRALSLLAKDRPRLPTITVTHHLEEIPPSSTHALLLADGAILAQGPIAEVLISERVSECFGVPVDVERRHSRWAAMVRL
jgi:iron complex transport system ATP-binding protein